MIYLTRGIRAVALHSVINTIEAIIPVCGSSTRESVDKLINFYGANTIFVDGVGHNII